MCERIGVCEGQSVGGFAMKVLRVLTIFVLVAYVLMTPAGQAVAQQRPGIRAQINAPEGCSIEGKVDTEDMFSFISSQIQALSFARAGERASFQTSAAGGDAPFSQVPNFVGLRQERIDNTCASFILSPYTSSKTQSMATVAKYLVFAYDQLAQMSDEMLGITLRESFPNDIGLSARVELSDWSARRQEILKNMTDAVNLSLSLLIRTNADGQPGNMILTQEQRNSLLDFLNLKFPSLGERDKVAPSGDFVKQATLIRSFLSGNDKPVN